MRGGYRRALELGAGLLEGRLARFEWVTSEDVAEAWRTFEQFRDEDWSFTDCVSRAVMARPGITRAFAFDAHFRPFGTVAVVP